MPSFTGVCGPTDYFVTPNLNLGWVGLWQQYVKTGQTKKESDDQSETWSDAMEIDNPQKDFLSEADS